MGNILFEPFSSIPDILTCLEDRLPARLMDTLHGQLTETKYLVQLISEIERRIKSLSKDDHGVKVISNILGVGFLTATTAIASNGKRQCTSFWSGMCCMDRAGVHDKLVLAATLFSRASISGGR
ncbi:hypothetical protein ACCY16_17710 [Candidatus Pantoea formicae]|uniref:hypothetical protein n=1 Tax=Candidatus Pantoea formicae TaxID=2608355 RepID=UPI003ED9D79B